MLQKNIITLILNFCYLELLDSSSIIDGHKFYTVKRNTRNVEMQLHSTIHILKNEYKHQSINLAHRIDNKKNI